MALIKPNNLHIVKSEMNFEIPPTSFAHYLAKEIQCNDGDAIAVVKIGLSVRISTDIHIRKSDSSISDFFSNID